MGARADGVLAGWSRGLAALLVVLAVALPAFAQPDSRANVWDAVANRAEERVDDPDTSTPVLEVLREQLVELRDEALSVQKAQDPVLADLNGRLKALGEPPADGSAEAPEIAARRAALNKQISDAQAPALEAQEALERANTLIEQIDRIVRGRFSAELMSRGPSPLLPATWVGAEEELRGRAIKAAKAVDAQIAEPTNQALAARRLPANILLLVTGIVVTVMLRRSVGRWIDRRASASHGGRAFGLLFALRNLLRIAVPVVAAGLLFAAFDLGVLFSQAPSGRLFELPLPIGLAIAAAWLASSLFSPSQATYRLVPYDDAEARQAARLTNLLGLLLAVATLFHDQVPRSDLSQGAQAAIAFPLVVLGSLGLWRAAGLIATLQSRLGIAPAHAQEVPGLTTSLAFLRVLVRVLRVFAVVAPLIGAAGYMAAASFLVFPSIATLGILGAGYVIYDLLCKVAYAFLGPSPAGDNAGLLPVVIGALVAAVALPLLALTWGARGSDLAEVWSTLNNGVTFGGIRVSAGVILTFAAVFALGIALTRLVQTIMRGTVLPRTRIDAGGRNAVLAGIGYIGFAGAALAAISAAGLDLSSLAIVAGALSVGIGFGLQNIVSNFVSGIILLVERPVKEGDWIEVGGYSGYVRGINVRSTEVETFDRASVILPNTSLIAGAVLNRTHKSMTGRLQLPLGVTYDADPKRVEAILLEIAESHPLVLQEPAPRVLFMELGPDSMNFELRCWLRDVNFHLSAKSDLNYEIMAAFHKAGIRVNYYGRDLPPSPSVPEPHDVAPAGGAAPAAAAPGPDAAAPPEKVPEPEAAGAARAVKA